MGLLNTGKKYLSVFSERYSRRQYERARARLLMERGVPDQIPPPSFAIGTGRSGTHLLQRIMSEDLTISSWHIDTADADSFAAYCEWHRLPVDRAGFLNARQRRIDEAVSFGQVYFESNPYMSFSALPLFGKFGAKFIHIVRTPEKVVNSHYVKGWYTAEFVKDDPGLPLGFNPFNYRQPNHFFGRVVPSGEEFLRWKKLTRIGRIAWMWNATHLRILEDLKEIPSQNRLFVRLEEIDFERYCDIHRFIGGERPMSQGLFEQIRRVKPGRGPYQRPVDEWSDQEREEFLRETSEVRMQLGYE